MLFKEIESSISCRVCTFLIHMYTFLRDVRVLTYFPAFQFQFIDPFYMFYRLFVIFKYLSNVFGSNSTRIIIALLSTKALKYWSVVSFIWLFAVPADDGAGCNQRNRVASVLSQK